MPFPCRKAEFSSGSVDELAAEDRRLVDLRAVEPPADLRVGAHAFGRAEDRDLVRAAAGDQFNFHSRSFTRAQCQPCDIIGRKSSFRDGYLIFAVQR